MNAKQNGISFVSCMLVIAAGLAGCSDKAPPSAGAPANSPAPVSSPSPAPAPKPSATTAAAPAPDGKAIYDSTCVACHALGIAGAPKFGDAQAWAPRLAKGIDVMYASSINGMQGGTGIMPPKGGRLDLSDAAVKAAVDYMVVAAAAQ